MKKINKFNSYKNKFGQIAIIEFAIIALFFAGIFIYFSTAPTTESSNYHSYNIETYLSSITKTNDFRNLSFNEDLSSINPTQDWSSQLQLINKSYTNYELTLTNNTNTLTIENCIPKYGKSYAQTYLLLTNSTNMSQIKVIFGVCY